MAILYAVVARGTVVLAEFSAVSGNAGAVARRIMEKLPPQGDNRLCYSQDRHIFHILKADGLTFLCMANDTFGSLGFADYTNLDQICLFDYFQGDSRIKKPSRVHYVKLNGQAPSLLRRACWNDVKVESNDPVQYTART
eukprot:Gb_17238 [translate_table: standard]